MLKGILQIGHMLKLLLKDFFTCSSSVPSATVFLFVGDVSGRGRGTPGEALKAKGGAAIPPSSSLSPSSSEMCTSPSSSAPIPTLPGAEPGRLRPGPMYSGDSTAGRLRGVGGRPSSIYSSRQRRLLYAGVADSDVSETAMPTVRRGFFHRC